MSSCAPTSGANVNASLRVRDEEDPADRPGELGENVKGDGDNSVCKRCSLIQTGMKATNSDTCDYSLNTV